MTVNEAIKQSAPVVTEFIRSHSPEDAALMVVSIIVDLSIAGMPIFPALDLLERRCRGEEAPAALADDAAMKRVSEVRDCGAVPAGMQYGCGTHGMGALAHGPSPRGYWCPSCEGVHASI